MGIDAQKPSQTPHIVYAFDQGFLYCSVLSAFSVLYHRDAPTRISFLIEHALPDLERAVGLLAKAFPKAELNIVIKPELGADFAYAESKATYFRLALSKYFSGRVIYLDGDTMLRADIGELFKTDMKGNPFGGVIDSTIERNLYLMKIGVRSAKKTNLKRHLVISDLINLDAYTNSGMLLVDLELVMSKPEFHRLFDCIAAQEFKVKHNLHFMDQDWINHVTHGNMFILDPKWNALWGNYRIRFPFPRKRRVFYRNSQINPSIVHFTGSYKPWGPRRIRLRKGMVRWDLEYKAMMAEMTRILGADITEI